MVMSREIVVKALPLAGKMTEDDFELVETTVRAPDAGEVLIKNLWLSIEAGQRTHLSTPPDHFDSNITDAIPMPRPGQALPGQAVGQVIESRDETLPVGSYVVGWLGWREYLVSGAAGLQLVDPTLAPPPSYLGTMGLWGAMAYFGLTQVGKIKPSETVVVSAAGGAVGIVAVQIAKLNGCRVVAIAGSDEKTQWLLQDLGADAAINYKTAADLRSELTAACPDGIDVHFDTVGGPILEAAIDVMKPHGRILAGGTLAAYDDGAPVAPSNYFWITPKRLSILGFTVVDFLDQLPEFADRMSAWLKEGKVVDRQTIYDGIDSAPRAWIDLFRGKNIGKMLVQLGQPLVSE